MARTILDSDFLSEANRLSNFTRSERHAALSGGTHLSGCWTETPHARPNTTALISLAAKGQTAEATSFRSAAASGLPDLAIDDVEVEGERIDQGDMDDESFRPGDTISLEWDVDNHGAGDAESSRTGIYLVGNGTSELVVWNSTDSTDAGQSDTDETDSFTLDEDLAPGVYAILVYADYRNEVAEDDEGNNGYSFFITVEDGGTLPNLVIGDVQLNGNPIQDGATHDTTFSPGDSIYLDWNVHNIGSEDAPGSRVGIFLVSGDSYALVEDNGTNAILSGESDTEESDSFVLSESLQAGRYAVLLFADDEFAVVESNENNGYSFFINVESGPPTGNDDFADQLGDGSAPIGDLQFNGAVNGFISEPDADDTYGDKDVFAVNLTAGQVYDLRLEATGGLPAGVFTIRDENFVQLEISGSGPDVEEVFRADRTGLFYVRVGSGGSPEDMGGYRLTLSPADQTGAEPDDWADAPGDAGSPGSVAPGGSQGGTIEAPGDLDYFTVNLTAGRVYHFSVTGEERSGAGAVGSVAISLRGPDAFEERLRSDDGSGRASFDFEVTESGEYYVRVGAGSDGGDTGGYRISVGAPRTPIPPPPPPEPVPGEPADEAVTQWFDDTFYNGMSAGSIIFGEGVLAVVRPSLEGMDETAALRVIRHIEGGFFLLGLVIDSVEAIDKIVNPEPGFSKEKAIFVELTTFMAGFGVAAGGLLLSPAGSIITGLIWTLGVDDLFRGAAAEYYDDFVAENGGLTHADMTGESGRRNVDAIFSSIDEADLVILDEAYYRAAYEEVGISIAQGQFGSVLAHYLSIGVDLGYRPNAGQLLARSDLAVRLLNDDPHAIGSAALFTQPLAHLAGDGISTAERTVGDAVARATGPATGATLDATLSAIAHRKALDLAVNTPADAIEAASARNSAWARRWSDGADFGQLFTAELEALTGSGATNAYRLFVVPSASGSAAEVLAVLKQQQGWIAGGYDTFGVAEAGGLWVVIVADRASGVETETPGTDGLSKISIYGSGDDESLYSGLRAGRLFGMAGNDTLLGGARRDVLSGGTGRDTLEGAGGADILEGGKGRDWASYASASAAVRADLQVPAANTGEAAGDSYADVENLLGSAFSDSLRGDRVRNVLAGGGGDDTLGGGAGADELNGGRGSDWADYGNPSEKVVADLKAPHRTRGDAEGDVYISIENLRGSSGNDALLGDDLANRIEGLAKNDLLSGRGGKDTLAGGAGRDKLKGGAGNDRFELASLDVDDADRILDFTSGEDRIALDGDVFGLSRVKPGQFVVGSAAGDANDRLIYDAAIGKLFFDADGTGAQAQVLIATLSGAPTLSAGDFVVI